MNRRIGMRKNKWLLWRPSQKAGYMKMARIKLCTGLNDVDLSAFTLFCC